MDVEDEYGISLTDAEFVGIDTVDDICRVIIGRQGV
jgi:acyl carrier protein